MAASGSLYANLNPEADVPQEASFPIAEKRAAGLVNGVPTEVALMSFADKLFFVLTQEEGNIAQLVEVALDTASPTSFETALPIHGEDMLPFPHLNPKTLLGARGEQRETLGHTYAMQVATMVLTKYPEETRKIVLAIGFQQIDQSREAFFDMLELLQKVI